MKAKQLSKFKTSLLSVAVSGALVGLSGCSVIDEKREYEQQATSSSISTSRLINEKNKGLSIEAKRLSQEVDKPYIISKSVPLSRDMQLPPALRGEINSVMLYRDEAGLPTIASRIQDATGILVKITPDALLPYEAFMPRLDKKEVDTELKDFPALSGSSFDMMMNNALSFDQARSQGPTSVGYGRQSPNPLPVGQHKLPTLLDAIAIKFGVYWKYDPAISALVFYRTETRYFEIKGIELKSSSSMTVGLSGTLDGSGSSGVASKSNASMALEDDKKGPMDAIINKIEQFMTLPGKISEGSNGLLVVTDTKEALDNIAAYIEAENNIRSRTIEFMFEEITIENLSSSQAGVDWDLAFGSAGNGNSFNINGLNSLLEQEGSALGIGAKVGAGQWAGSSVAIQALSKIGTIVDRKTNTFGSNNGQPATSGRPAKIKYIDKLEQTKSYSDNSAPTVSVSQAEEVSGRLLTVLPHAYSNGDINLAIKYDNTPDPVLEKQTLPDGSYVQSPKTRSEVLVRSTIVRSGQPFIVNAYTHKKTTSDERRIDKTLSKILGGSDVAEKSEVLTVMVLTAYVKER